MQIVKGQSSIKLRNTVQIKLNEQVNKISNDFITFKNDHKKRHLHQAKYIQVNWKIQVNYILFVKEIIYFSTWKFQRNETQCFFPKNIHSTFDGQKTLFKRLNLSKESWNNWKVIIELLRIYMQRLSPVFMQIWFLTCNK